jgi:hypothetical protein
MAKQVVQMDYAVIGDVSKGFRNAYTMLNTVEKVLAVAIVTLQTLALVSAGTSAALARYLENIRQKVKHLANVCNEFSGDLARAIDDHRKGDFEGKRYFGEGVRG